MILVSIHVCIHMYIYIFSKLSYISWDDDPPVRYAHYLEKEEYKVWETPFWAVTLEHHRDFQII